MNPDVLEDQIAQWRGYLQRRRAIQNRDVEELEGHLRDDVAGLTGVGLSGDEAFLVAVKRLGNLDALSREFAREHSIAFGNNSSSASTTPRPQRRFRIGLSFTLSLR